jgi:hypothetical protein
MFGLHSIAVSPSRIFAGGGTEAPDGFGGDLVNGFAEILQALRDIPEILISGVVTAFSGTAQDAG